MADPPSEHGELNQANPYIAGSPVTVPEMFFGREDVFTFVREALVGRHRDNVIVLYGQRRTGKTSILHQLQHHLGPRYVCVFIDLHALALDSLGGALWELAASVNRVLRREHQIDLPRVDRDVFMADPRAQFENEFLGRVLDAIGDRHLLLMLDEVIRLQEQVEAGKLDKEIFIYLRHLMQHHERLSFLFSLGSGLEEMSKEYALLFNVALYKKISFLDRKSAVALIREPVEDLFQVRPDAVERILEITCGHPYFTQLICHSVFNRWQRQRTGHVGREDVDAIVDEAVERGLAVLKHVWEDSTPGEKAVLAGLAAVSDSAAEPVDSKTIAGVWSGRGAVLPERELVGAIQSLVARDVIVGQDTYAFAVELQRRWVRHYRRVEWVHEEIAPALAAWSSAQSPTVTADGPARVEPRRSPPFVSLAPTALAGLALLVAAAAFWLGTQRQGPIAWPAPTSTTLPGIPTIFADVPTVAPTATSGAAAPTTAPAPTSLAAAPTTAPAPASTSPPAVTKPAVVLAGDLALVNGLVFVGGAMWAATDAGLVRWTPDGVGQVVSASLGFGDDGREAVAVAPDGTLWIGGGGVAHARISGERLQQLGFYDRDDGLGTGAVRVVFVDTDGSIWAGGSPDSGRPPPLSHFDGKPGPDGRAWRTLDVPLNDATLATLQLSFWSIFRSDDRSLWLGLARDGLLRWDGTRWTHFPPLPASQSACDDVRVRRVLADRRGTLWAAASCQGVLRFDANSGRWQAVALGHAGAAKAMTRFANGDLWVAGAEFVARSADDGQTWSIVGSAAEGIFADASAIVEGPDGRAWLADYGGGISIFDGSQWRHLQR